MFNIINKNELIAKDIEFKISNKEFTKTIPSERKLAEQYGVSRNTVREAIAILQNKKIISLSSNYYQINEPQEDYDWLEIFGKKTNYPVTNYIVQNKVIEANKKISQKVRVPLATPIRLIVYKRAISENESTRNLSIDYIYSPEKIADKLELKRLQEHSFWDLLVSSFKGLALKEYQNLSIESVTFEEANLLNIPVRAKILQRTSSIFVDDIPIYFISKKIPENSILFQVDNHFQINKD